MKYKHAVKIINEKMSFEEYASVANQIFGSPKKKTASPLILRKTDEDKQTVVPPLQGLDALEFINHFSPNFPPNLKSRG